MQDAPNLQEELESPRGAVSLHLILTIFLGVGMVLFGVLATLAWTDNNEIHNTLDQRIAEAEKRAAAKQKEEDTIANQKANELPYYNFVANPQDGSFELQIPKNWSIYNGRSANGQVQLNMLVHPQTITENLGSGSTVTNNYALVVQLLRQNQTDFLKKYADKVKKKQLTQTTVQVSGMGAVKLEGSIDDQRRSGVILALPVRDKTLVFISQDANYLQQFNQVISTAKVNP